MRRFQSGWRYRPDFRYDTLENLLREWRKRLGDGPRPAFPDGLASSFRRLNTAVNQYFATPQLSYLVGSACACRRGQVRLRVLCTESLPAWKSTSASGAQFFTKSFLGDDAAVLARSSGEEFTPPRRRAGVASMAWRSTRRFSTITP